MTVHLKTAYVDGPMSLVTILIGRCAWVKPRVEVLDPRQITLLSALVSTGHHYQMSVPKAPSTSLPEKYENVALFLRLSLPSTQIRHENGAFRKRSSENAGFAF